MLDKAVIGAVIVGGVLFALQLKFGPNEHSYQKVPGSEISRKHAEQSERFAAAYAQKLEEAKGNLPEGWIFGEGFSEPEAFQPVRKPVANNAI